MPNKPGKKILHPAKAVEKNRYAKEYEAIEQLQREIGYSFVDGNLCIEAMTHRSAVTKTSSRCNERLEFLGDSVLGLAVSTFLWNKFSNTSDEGDLSRQRSFLVNEEILAKIARSISLGDCLLLGKGEQKSGGRNKDSLLADAFEALIGAIYLDSSYKQSEEVLSALYKTLITKKFLNSKQDYKSKLQELSQEQVQKAPQYVLIKSQGPDHRKSFDIGVQILGVELARGVGKTKREASQEAAKNALENVHTEGFWLKLLAASKSESEKS